MRKIAAVLFFSMFVLVSCSGGVSQVEAQQNATLVSVPMAYAGKTNPFGVDAVTAGSQIFHTNCEVCHGVVGYGDGPAGQALEPRPKNLAELQTIASDDYLFWRINEGKPGTSMVAWKGVLTDEQIWQVISFIRTLQ